MGKHRREDVPQRDSQHDEPEEPVLPHVSRDDRDEGLSEDPDAGRRDEAWYRRERPPHHE